MAQAIRHWLMWLILAAIAPLAHAWVQGFIAAFLLPLLSYFKLSSGVAITAVVVAANIAGAFIAMLLLALPLGYLTQAKHRLFGGLLGASLVLILFLLALIQDGFATGYQIFLAAMQYAGILISAQIAAHIGARLRASRVEGEGKRVAVALK